MSHPSDWIACLHRDPHWLAVSKPSGIPTTAPPTAGVVSLVDRVREIFRIEGPVHPLSRLDVDVTGVVLFAVSPEAIEEGRRERERGEYRRRYEALLACAPEPPEGLWAWTIGVDPRDPKRRVAGGGREPRNARTRYTTLGTCAVARVAMDLDTGRTHQIRVHAAKAGCPVIGDRTYGGPRHLTLDDGAVITARRVMLHAARVRIPGTEKYVEAPWAADMLDVWKACGGVEIAAPE